MEGRARLWIAAAASLVCCCWRWRRCGCCGAGGARGWRRRPIGRVRLRHPVVLVHGIVGFDELKLFRWKRGYFSGIGQHLQEPGGHGVPGAAAPAGGGAGAGGAPGRVRRAAWRPSGSTSSPTAWAASTPATPSPSWAWPTRSPRWSPSARPTTARPSRSWARSGPALTARALVKRLGLSSDSLDWLTPTQMATFNVEIADDPRVAYASVVCRAGQGLLEPQPAAGRPPTPTSSSAPAPTTAWCPPGRSAGAACCARSRPTTGPRSAGSAPTTPGRCTP